MFPSSSPRRHPDVGVIPVDAFNIFCNTPMQKSQQEVLPFIFRKAPRQSSPALSCRVEICHVLWAELISCQKSIWGKRPIMAYITPCLFDRTEKGCCRRRSCDSPSLCLDVAVVLLASHSLFNNPSRTLETAPCGLTGGSLDLHKAHGESSSWGAACEQKCQRQEATRRVCVLASYLL